MGLVLQKSCTFVAQSKTSCSTNSLKFSQRMNLVLIITLCELIFFLFLWLMNETSAYILTIVVSIVAGVVLFVSILSEMIERSKIDKRYFSIMGVTILLPWAVYFLMKYLA